MRAATLAHLIAAEDLADAAAGRVGRQRPARPRPRWARRGSAGDRGPGRRRRARRGRGDRLVGPPRGTARAHRRAPPASRGVPRDPASPRARGGRGPRPSRRRTAPRRATPRRRSTRGSRSRRRGSPIASSTTTTSGAAASSGSSPADATAATWAAGGRGELGDFVDGVVPGRAPGRRRRPPRARRVRDDRWPADVAARGGRAAASAAAGSTRRWSSASTIENTGDTALDARIGSEWAITMLGGGGNPEAWWELEGERTSHDGTGCGAERRASGPGQRLARRGARDDDRARWRRVDRADRDDLELGGRLRARLPGQRAAPVVAGPPRAGRALVRDHPPRSGGQLATRRQSEHRAPADSGLRIRQPAACAPRADVGGEIGRVG